MEVLAGEILTGEKIVLSKNKYKLTAAAASTAVSEHDDGGHVGILRRRHSSFLFQPRAGYNALRRGRSMSIRIGCSDVVNAGRPSVTTAEAESEDVSSTISSDSDESDEQRLKSTANKLSSTNKKLCSCISSENNSSEAAASKTEAAASSKKAAPASVSAAAVAPQRLSKNAEQIEALLKRINEENKKTKEVLENIQKNEVTMQPKQSLKKSSLPEEFYSADLSALLNLEQDLKTKNLATAVIPSVRTAIIEKTSTTFLDAYQINTNMTTNRYV
jgi:hypothetical protein